MNPAKTYSGLTRKQLCEMTGLNPETVRWRLTRGWSVERILSTRKYTHAERAKAGAAAAMRMGAWR
jgi:uncharacterized protein YjcR